jgi:hypothetical protein
MSVQYNCCKAPPYLGTVYCVTRVVVGLQALQGHPGKCIVQLSVEGKTVHVERITLSPHYLNHCHEAPHAQLERQAGAGEKLLKGFQKVREVLQADQVRIVAKGFQRHMQQWKVLCNIPRVDGPCEEVKRAIGSLQPPGACSMLHDAEKQFEERFKHEGLLDATLIQVGLGSGFLESCCNGIVPLLPPFEFEAPAQSLGACIFSCTIATQNIGPPGYRAP